MPCQGIGRGFESRLPLHLTQRGGVSWTVIVSRLVCAYFRCFALQAVKCLNLNTKSNIPSNLTLSGTESTFVYFVIRTELGFSLNDKPKYLKIGHSKHPKKRIYSFRSSDLFAEIIHSIEFDSKKLACAVECGFHRIFSNDKAFDDSKEWFRVNDSTIQKLQNLGISCENFV